MHHKDDHTHSAGAKIQDGLDKILINDESLESEAVWHHLLIGSLAFPQ